MNISRIFMDFGGEFLSKSIDMWMSILSASWERKGEVDYFKQVYNVWEKFTSDTFDMWMRSPFFIWGAEKGFEGFADFKKHYCEFAERILKNLRISTKNDVDKILSTLNNLESKLPGLSERVRESSKGHTTTKKEGKGGPFR
ncbi:MAG: hypothetical protein HYW01_07510 [Deltaproteobacteria bacterium]|nr:hypothetical protein [Deltaproteobacteria bacterium]